MIFLLLLIIWCVNHLVIDRLDFLCHEVFSFFPLFMFSVFFIDS